jgi:hypothetical protein
MTEALDWIREHRPELSRRVRVHETGDPLPNLGGVRAIAFLLADPLREWHPHCYAEALDLATKAEQLGLAIVNPPQALSNTIKSTQARLWMQAGIPTPAVSRFRSLEELHEAACEHGFPLVMRGDEKHSQDGTRVFWRREDLESFRLIDLPDPGAAGPLVDTRVGYRGARADSIWARYYHKKRVLVLGPRIRTKHVFFSTDPIVGAKTFTFGRYRWRSRLGLPVLLSRDERAMVEADVDHWRNGIVEGDLMRRAMSVLGLQFAAIDYSTLADGTPILWEANPYFSLPRREDLMLPRYRGGARLRLSSYYEAIADFLEDLVSHEPSEWTRAEATP